MPLERTGPSIASATNSLVPPTAAATKWRTPALLGVAALIVVIVVVGVFAAGSSSSIAVSANPLDTNPSPQAVAAPTEPEPKALPTATLEPSPSASVFAPVPTGTAVMPTATEAPQGTAVSIRDKTGAPPPTARPKVPPPGTASAKKPRDWGL